jgi:hypothetical protein
MVTAWACASIAFSTNSAIAFNGLLCESAMIRMAFQLGISAHRDRPFRHRDRPFRSNVTAHFGRS